MNPLPGYLEPCIDEFVCLRRHQGLEMLQMARDQLRLRAGEHGNVGQACLLTCQTLYKEDAEGWTQAKNLLSTLVGGDGATCITGLNKCTEQITANPIMDEMISKQLLGGPRNTSRRAQNRNYSSLTPRNNGTRRGNCSNASSSYQGTNANSAPNNQHHQHFSLVLVYFIYQRERHQSVQPQRAE